MPRPLALLWILSSVYFTISIPNQDIIISFCKSKSLSIGTIFSCGTKTEHVHLIKVLGKTGLRFLIVDIVQHPNYSVTERLNGQHCHVAVLLDATCTNALNVLSQGKSADFFETRHWLITSNSTENILKLFVNVPLNINSDVYIAVADKPNNWTIFDAYNPASSRGGQLKLQKLGYYSSKSGFNIKITDNKYKTRKNMTGVTFTSAVVMPNDKTTLQEYLTSEENRQENSMHRFQSVTVGYCRDMFNFTLKVRATDSWGYMQANGTFDGLVGLLERKLVDFGSSPLLCKLDRIPVVDYSYGNWILRSAFIYRHPKVAAASYEIFLRPLSNTVWIAVVVFMGIIMLALKLIFSRENLLSNNARDGIDSSWSFLFLFTLGAFCQQGATCYPQLMSSRTLSVFVFLFCILIYQFYSASIVSYLLMDPPKTIHDLKGLTDSSLKVGIEDILIDRNYFVQTTDPMAIELFDKKISGTSNDPGFYAPSDGLELVQRGGFAYHVETSTAYPIIENTFTNQEICELEEVQLYSTQPMHTNLQKNSPYREMMNYCMLRLVETGTMDRLRKYWDARKPNCIESAKKVNIHVSLSEFSCGLIALAYGIGFALTFLICELLIYDRERLRTLCRRQSRQAVVKPFIN